MRILEYADLHPGPHRSRYDKVVAALERGDFRAAQVKKLAQGGFYRARLDDANRLLLRIARHRGETCLLLLEIIENHSYEKSRFLRGAAVDEARLVEVDAPEAVDAPTLPYVHPERSRFHLLDKPLCFDDAQEALFRLPPPLIVVGSAGSGKTALTLERMKHLEGEVLYVTLSAYLAEHARSLYRAHHYENPRQEVDFLAFRELLETIEDPPGREVDFAAFRAWFERHRRALGLSDPHRLFEEFRGVLTGGAADKPWLSRADYLALGVRQSVFTPEERGKVYALFEKYLLWLTEARLYDPNIVAHSYLARVDPRYDFVVVDEVQDFTNAQLSLALKGLRRAGHFLLTGDANQVVHPNFFSWAGLRRLFWQSEDMDPQRALRILAANYRNSPAVTALANRCIKLKHARFGSVDRESNYLSTSASDRAGSVELLPAKDAVLRELDARTRQSARVAVLVLRDEDKPAAASRFRTPLVFSVREAKGLEYEHALLFNLVSSARAAFAEIARGVAGADLERETLDYARAKDKTDKSLEIYKFFVNAFYVAVTRAVDGVTLIEEDPSHPFLALLGLKTAGEEVRLAAQRSDAEEWSREARRLELQGRLEQAAAIRNTMLGHRPVPWEVMDLARLEHIVRSALDPKGVSSKARRQLYEYAMLLDEPWYRESLARMGFCAERPAPGERAALTRKHLDQFETKNLKPALAAVETHGIEYRTPHNLTPLMAAACVGNVALVEALCERGADPGAADAFGRTALHLALSRAMGDPAFAGGPLARLWEALAPPSLPLMADSRLRKLDRAGGEYLLVQIMLSAMRARVEGAKGLYANIGFATADFAALAAFPENAVPDYRKRRAYLSGLLAKNEIGRVDLYNKKLFLRIAHGRYVLSPALRVRQGEAWIPVHDLAHPASLRDGSGPAVQAWLDRLAKINLAVESRQADEPRAPAEASIQTRPERSEEDPTAGQMGLEFDRNG
ncbi:MAG: hypothetical protein HY039_06045 [Nitrospirae bacterium]|nr:hypothetical protein [Nitrospirota bacterium]